MSESAGRHLMFFWRHCQVWERQNGAEAPILATLSKTENVYLHMKSYWQELFLSAVSVALFDHLWLNLTFKVMNHEESNHAAESWALNNLIFWVQLSAGVQFTPFWKEFSARVDGKTLKIQFIWATKTNSKRKWLPQVTFLKQVS